jgi:hypothetical protein
VGADDIALRRCRTGSNGLLDDRPIQPRGIHYGPFRGLPQKELANDADLRTRAPRDPAASGSDQRDLEDYIDMVLRNAKMLAGVELTVRGDTPEEKAASFLDALIKHGLADWNCGGIPAAKRFSTLRTPHTLTPCWRRKKAGVRLRSRP